MRRFQRRHDDAVAAAEKALSLCPNGAGHYHMAGMYHGYSGDFRKAAQYEEQAQRLSPLSRNESMVDEARARFHLGELAAARDIASRVLAEKPRWLTARTVLGAALWNLGQEGVSAGSRQKNAGRQHKPVRKPLGKGISLPLPKGS